MKNLLLFSTLLFLGFGAIAQEDESTSDGYELIKDLTDKIKVDGAAVKFERVEFTYLPEYAYEDGVRFGSWVKLFIHGIEDVNVFNNMSFVLMREKITRKEDGAVIIFNDWNYDDGQGIHIEDDKTHWYRTRLKIGKESYAGTYLWEVELADMCADKTTKISLEFKIIPNPNIQTETKGDVEVLQPYLYDNNENDQYIYAGDSVHLGELIFSLYGVKGFKLDDGGIAKIGLECDVLDTNDEVIFSSGDQNMGAEAFVETTDGMFEPYFPLKIGAAQLNNTIKVRLHVWDKNDPTNDIVSTATVFVRT